jgi:hypothetical protein
MDILKDKWRLSDRLSIEEIHKTIIILQSLGLRLPAEVMDFEEYPLHEWPFLGTEVDLTIDRYKKSTGGTVPTISYKELLTEIDKLSKI